MHDFETMLSEIISTLKGSQGLASDMTSAQNLHLVKYYWVKYRSMVNTTTVESPGGDGDLFNTAPVEFWNLIRLVNATRWLSTEKAYDRLITTLSIPASKSLISHICTFCGGPDSENWKITEQYCLSFNSSQLSHTMLTFWYIANHASGGKKSEGAVGCLSVLDFLGFPFHWITLMNISLLYPSWAKFSDNPCRIGVKEMCASTVSIERVRFDRLFEQAMTCQIVHYLFSENEKSQTL